MAKHITKKLRHGKKSKHSKTKISKNSRRHMKKRRLTKKMRGGANKTVIVASGQEPTLQQRQDLLKQAQFGNNTFRVNPLYKEDEEGEEEEEDEDEEEEVTPSMTINNKNKYFQSVHNANLEEEKRKVSLIKGTMYLPGSSETDQPIIHISSSNTNSGYGDIPEGAIEHIWFKHWPDHGVPSNDKMPTFIQFMNYIISQFQSDFEKKQDSNTVIHCSAGVGRTGVVYVILSLIFQDKLVFNPPKKNKINDTKINDTKINDDEQKVIVQKIYTKIFEARTFRRYMVQIYEQFVLICHLFGVETQNIILGNFNTEDEKFKNKSDENKEVIMKEHNKNSFNKDSLIKSGNENGEDCKAQNRYGNILPYEDNIPYINQKEQPVFVPNYKGICNNYINASELDLNDPKTPGVHLGIIAAQCPTKNTKQDFYKMLINNETKRIIMVTNLKEGNTIKCDDYFTEKQTGTPQVKPWGEIRYLQIKN